MAEKLEDWRSSGLLQYRVNVVMGFEETSMGRGTRIAVLIGALASVTATAWSHDNESGRTLNGVLAKKDARAIVLKTSDGKKVSAPRDDIAEMSVSGQSHMPENLLDGLAEQEVRDLFAYLRSSQPLNERRK